jgi:methylmalonyl-CoA mutase N-terminal domain/subunit
MQTDDGTRAVIGENYFRHDDDASDFGEVFRMDPKAAGRVRERYAEVMETRDNAAVETVLGRLRDAAMTDDENLMPHLVECCHAYATVGEMVATLTREWGEFKEPVRL